MLASLASFAKCLWQGALKGGYTQGICISPSVPFNKSRSIAFERIPRGVVGLSTAKLVHLNTCLALTHSRRKYPRPPVFSGRPVEFLEWQFTIEEALAVVSPADEVRFAMSYLGGDAHRWFMTAYPDGDCRNDWTSLRNGLRAAFSPDGERALAFHPTRLLWIRQVGPVENYIAEFRSLCISSSEVDELTKAILFTEGLKVELRRAVKQAQVETLQTAMRAARSAADCEPELIEQDNSRRHHRCTLRRVTSARKNALAGLRRLPPCMDVRILSVVSTVDAWVT